MPPIARAALALPVVAYGWNVAASAIYCFGTAKLDLFRFPFLQWTQAAPWWRLNWTMTTWVGAGAAVPTVVLLLCASSMIRFWWRRRHHRLTPPSGGGIRPSVAGVTDNFGSARILTNTEALRRYPGPSGVLIGELGTGSAGRAPLVIDPCTSGAGHGMLVAGTRAGKTTSAVTGLLHWPSSAIVLDPSAEMGGMLEETLSARGKRVYLLNPEVLGSGFNALDWIDPTKPLAGLAVKEVISWVFPEDQKHVQTDGYFQPSGRALCEAILAHLIWSDVPAHGKTLRAFRDMVVTPEQQMPSLLADIHAESKSPMARDIAGTLMKITPKQFSGIYGQATIGTAWLSEPELAGLVSGRSFRTIDITNGETIVFAQIPLHILERTPGAGRVIIGALMQAVYNAKGQTKGRVLTLLDEAWALGPMQIQKSALVAGAKSGLTLIFLYQAVGQVREIWGEDGAVTLYNNLEWRAYAACRDDKTAEEVSKAFGERSVMSYSDGTNTGSQRPFGLGPGSRSSGDTTNTSEIKRRLVLPQEVLDAPRDELFVVAHGNMRLRMAVYYRRPDLATQVKPSPFYRATAD